MSAPGTRFVQLLARFGSQPRSWVRAVARRREVEGEMEAEIAAHLEMLAADLVRLGQTPAEARRNARVALGSPVAAKDGMRRSLGVRFVDDVAADLQYGARMLRKSPGFTLVATLSLALAIGANTTIFSLAKQVLYERLAVPRASELRLLAWTGTQKHVAVHNVWGDYSTLPSGRVTSASFSYPVFVQLRAQNRVMQDLFGFKETGMNATIAGNAQPVQVELVSGNYYAELQVRPILGRGIEASDDARPGSGPVAVISYGLWERAFGKSAQVVGQIVKLNEIAFTIVGVNPQGFTGAKGTQQSPDLFVPMSMQPLIDPHGESGSRLTDPKEWWMNVMGRVKPGVNEATAQAALDAVLAASVRATAVVKPDEDVPRMDLRDGSRGLFFQKNTYAKPMTVLLTMVGFVLLLACANIANLMLARGSQRQREMSVRLALGAGRARIARQMLVESLMLAGLGGLSGLLVGYLGSRFAPLLTENAWQRSDFRIHFDWLVFAFTAGVTLVTGILFGLAPAWAATRAQVSSGLKETSQSATRRRKGWGGRWLVGFQIALSTLLVIGAGLFLRTLGNLKKVDVGFRTDHLLLAEIDAPEKLYPAGKDMALHTRLLEAMAGTPGVEAVSPAWVTYLAGQMNRTDFVTEGATPDKNRDDGEAFNVVGANFFAMMRIPILAGRAFGAEDTLSAARVGIVNAALARERFPNQDPIGKRFNTGEETDRQGQKQPVNWIRIVGICADTHYNNLREDPTPPQFFLPFTQQKSVGGG